MEISRRHFDLQERAAVVKGIDDLLQGKEPFADEIAAAKAEQDAALQAQLDGMTRNERRVFMKRMKRVLNRK